MSSNAEEMEESENNGPAWEAFKSWYGSPRYMEDWEFLFDAFRAGWNAKTEGKPSAAERSMMLTHKKDWGPGWRYFACLECPHGWREESRHCESMSTSFCPVCHEDGITPHRFERHYEWITDKSGNLIYDADGKLKTE